MTTAGVYQRAKRVMSVSVVAFLSVASSTSERMRSTVDSSYGVVTSTSSTPVWLMQPLMISLPACTARGMDSPVSAEVSSSPSPFRMIPSSGTRSPGRTMMVSPTSTSSGNTSSSAPSRRTHAVSGRMSMREEMERRER